MNNILRLKERVEIAVELGESYYREFKSAFEGPPQDKRKRDFKDICYNVAKELVAFANADGGELFIGIEDDGRITGVPHREELIQNIFQASEKYVLPETPLSIKRKNIITIDDQKVIYFSVEKGSKYIHQTSRGECFKREDKNSVPYAADLLRFERDEVLSRTYDREFEPLAEITDLNIDLVRKVASESTGISDITPEKFLQHVELAEFDGDRLRLRKAALLLFAKDINKWHPRSRIRVLRVNGAEELTGTNYNVTEVADVSGNIFEVVEIGWEALRPSLVETRFRGDGRFKTQVIYPESACREALINAVTHRDYSLEGRGIEIRIFEDRLEVLSPGKLLSRLTIKDLQELKGAHESRNTYIARVLREYGYIRELGEGIRRMFDVMNQHELVPPQIESPNKSFIVTLFHRYIYTKQQKLWLDSFKHLDLSRDEKTVVVLGVEGRLISTREIFEQVGIVDTDYHRRLVEGLRDKGILETKVSSAQAYSIAKKDEINKREVPRYQIVLPK